MYPKTLVWLRQDLRLHDNQALHQATKQGHVIALYIVDEQSLGSAQKWWLYHSLKSLESNLKNVGIDLILRSSKESLLDIAQETNVSSVFWNRCYDPKSIQRDTLLKNVLKEKNITVQTFNSSLLTEPEYVRNKQGGVFKVFTPFWKHVLSTLKPKAMLNLEIQQIGGQVPYPSDHLDNFNLLPKTPNWAFDFELAWKPGEQNALALFKSFMENGFNAYSTNRDYPSIKGTSTLSPYLHFGEIGPHQIFRELENYGQFLAEIGWREFAHYLLYHFPSMLDQPLNPKFKDFPYVDNEDHFDAWTKGLTGYPLVDAGMRQLWKTGWMHNRVRMVTASFLTKHLLLPWQKGAAWFYDTLLDADLASNTISWQWVAGCGADAAPYFRIFNPIMQSQKFDASGEYIRTWIPELRNIPTQFIHEPWKYSKIIDYPKPIIEHSFARMRALEAYSKIAQNIDNN